MQLFVIRTWKFRTIYSVVDYDDSELTLLADVPIISVIHPKYQSGKLAADILFDQIEHQGQNMPRQMIINSTLAIQNSVKILGKS